MRSEIETFTQDCPWAVKEFGEEFALAALTKLIEKTRTPNMELKIEKVLI